MLSLLIQEFKKHDFGVNLIEIYSLVLQLSKQFERRKDKHDLIYIRSFTYCLERQDHFLIKSLGIRMSHRKGSTWKQKISAFGATRDADVGSSEITFHTHSPRNVHRDQVPAPSNLPLTKSPPYPLDKAAWASDPFRTPCIRGKSLSPTVIRTLNPRLSGL